MCNAVSTSVISWRSCVGGCQMRGRRAAPCKMNRNTASWNLLPTPSLLPRSFFFASCSCGGKQLWPVPSLEAPSCIIYIRANSKRHLHCLRCTELSAKSPDVPSNRRTRRFFETNRSYRLIHSFHYMTRERLKIFSFFLHSFLSFSSRESEYRCSVFAGTKAWHIRIYGAQLRTWCVSTIRTRIDLSSYLHMCRLCTAPISAKACEAIVPIKISISRSWMALASLSNW